MIALLRRPLLLVAVLAVIASVLVVGGEERVAAPLRPAADLTQFDAGNIISDEVFFSSRSMTAENIQTFISAKGSSCVAGGDGTPCLKDFRQDTTTRAADSFCNGYVAGARESAATIIAKSAVSCGISPKVLLVMLQKEQGLVLGSGAGLYPDRYRKAMGFACPDTAPCDEAYFGFQNQVYSAARQYQKYAANPSSYAYRAGRTVNVLWHPNAACGSASVTIKNQATAGLYIYTPYQPNAAALRAGFGTGDGCSSYGNRNFWLYFTDWFVSTQSDAIAAASPKGSLDGLTLTPSGFSAVGWSFDPDAPNSPVTVRATVDGATVASASATGSRPDVATAFGVGPNHGFAVAGTLSNGVHRVCILADNLAGPGAPREVGCKTVTFTDVRPTVSPDVFQEQADGTVLLSGWAFDGDGTAPQIHVYDNGVGRAYTTGVARPDVQAAFPAAGPTSGYSITLGPLSGTHDICAFAVDTVAPGNNWLVGCKKVVYRAPIGSVDVVTETTTGTVRVLGWAVDQSTPTQSIPVHVYVNGRGAAYTASAHRPDVDAVVGGVGPAHGIDLDLAMPAGVNEVCVFAINTGVIGGHTLLRCVKVTLSYQAPTGAVDRIAVTAPGQVTVSGWAFDRSVPSAATVMHYWVDGRPVAQGTADESRPDVHQVYGMGAAHGFSDVVNVSPGPHLVCVFALNVGVPGPNLLVRCQDVVG